VSDAIHLSVTLVPGTDEYRAYNRIKRMYLAEINERQKHASDDEPCKTELGKCELVRGAILALADVPQKDIPDYIDAGWKRKGRPHLGVDEQESEDEQADSDSRLNDRTPLLH